MTNLTLSIPTAQVPWWRLPFTKQPWRLSLYIVLAAPATIIGLGDGGRLRRRLAEALLSRTIKARRFRGLCCLPLDLLAVVVMVYAWLIVVLNLAYPARWLIGMGGSTSNSWGGPTMLGAWAFHAVFGGLTFLFAMPWILKGITWLQIRALGG